MIKLIEFIEKLPWTTIIPSAVGIGGSLLAYIKWREESRLKRKDTNFTRLKDLIDSKDETIAANKELLAKHIESDKLKDQRIDNIEKTVLFMVSDNHKLLHELRGQLSQLDSDLKLLEAKIKNDVDKEQVELLLQTSLKLVADIKIKVEDLIRSNNEHLNLDSFTELEKTT